jgi:hypothetical protein
MKLSNQTVPANLSRSVHSLVRAFALLTIAFAVFVIAQLCHAQDQQPTASSAIELARTGMQADRNTIITTGMNFSDKDAAVFWPIYRDYQYQRSKLDDRRMVVIKQYTQKYQALTDAEAKNMAEQMLEYDSRLLALKKAYFKKFNKALPALTVSKFFQLERRIDLMMDIQVESSLPLLTQAQFTGQVK